MAIMFDCKACGKTKCYWDSICGICRYYQHSCMSPRLYNYLKEEGNAEKLYSKILDSDV